MRKGKDVLPALDAALRCPQTAHYLSTIGLTHVLFYALRSTYIH
jgi:hypothetical protein